MRCWRRLRRAIARIIGDAAPYETVRKYTGSYDRVAKSIVTTTVYLRKDVPALSLAGTKQWWPRKMLERFAVAHLSLPIKTVSDTFNRVAEAVTETRAMIPGYLNDHPGFREIGESMMREWDEGVRGLVGR